MTTLTFKDLTFEEKQDKIQINFLRLFYFDILKQELKDISDFKIIEHAITFKNISEQKAKNKFNNLLDKGFRHLKNKLTKKPTIYIHQFSNIPLIGHIAFGIIDRHSSLIEVKPITSCNLNCIYCSVDQDIRPVDFVVEKDYLLKEIKEIIKFKQTNLEVHFGSQGEVLLYQPLPDLIKDLSKIKQITKISMETNGMLLTKELADKLINSGLTQFNLSINALDPVLAQKIAGCPYDINHIKKIAKHIAKKSKLIIAPVWIPKINDEEIPKLIEFSKELNCKIGIQNFLNYRFGRNPVKQKPFEKFEKDLKKLEEEYNTKLILTGADFNIRPTKPLPKPFKKGEVLKTKILLLGRLKNEKLAVERDRIISIPNCTADIGEKITIKITRTKHNIFIAEQL
ncbi:radical SAM protein [Candidatus Woesearchaeota archaeon]|nr:radical SAM protein [Candidatus Woesearchaeota archaeon]